MVNFAKVELVTKRLEAKSGWLTCPACGEPYNLKDYRKDLDHIYCSRCKAELPKDVPGQGAVSFAAVASSGEC